MLGYQTRNQPKVLPNSEVSIGDIRSFVLVYEEFCSYERKVQVHHTYYLSTTKEGIKASPKINRTKKTYITTDSVLKVRLNYTYMTLNYSTRKYEFRCLA